MNVGIIFAGGTGHRMNTKTRPKQFLELYGKPILVYTIERFNNHPEIDGIVLVILEGWVEYCNDLVKRFGLNKVQAIVSGGDTAMDSQYIGLQKAEELYGKDAIVLIHDGVRPLIDEETISRNIASVRKCGSAITVASAIETITINDENGEVGEIIDRSKVKLARAPQSFFLKDLLEAHEKAKIDDISFVDSASMMKHYGHTLYTVEGGSMNIKITTPCDFYMFRALIDARENSQIFGV